MGKPRKPTPNILLQNPGLINSVKANPPERVNNMKEQLKCLRRFYRFMRDDQGMEEVDIIPMMADLFPAEVKNLIDLAGFIETKIIYLPYNQIPRWVTVPFEAIYSLVHYALTTTGDQNSAMRLVTAYLWHIFSKGDEITPPRDIVNCSGLNMENFKDDLKSKFHVNIEYNRKSVIFGKEVRTSWKIQWNDSLPVTGITNAIVTSERSSIRLLPPQEIPEQLEDEFALHQLYYPQQSIQFVDRKLPLIHSDRKYATIPLVNGIVPILISYLIPTAALHNWLYQFGVQKPSKRIGTLYKYANTAVTNLDGTVKYIRPSGIKFKMAPRIHIGNYLRIQYHMMKYGLPININTLRGIDPQYDPMKSKEKNKVRIKKLNEYKQEVLASVSNTGGWLRGTFNLESHSERTHYRKNNIQSFPSCFKQSVEAPDGYEFVYLDVMANDISILFNIAKDSTGLNLLNNGEDPYRHLAHFAFPDEDEKTARDKVKEVVSPWIYGAGVNTIIKGDKLIDAVGVKAVKSEISKEFPAVAAWIRELNRSVRTDYEIPARFNILDNLPIPMPGAFSGRMAPSMLVQRLGATIMKQAVIWLDEHSTSAKNIMLTVHDSILIATRKDAGPIATVEVIQAIKYGIQRTPGIDLLVLKTGRGPTWKQADENAEVVICGK